MPNVQPSAFLYDVAAWVRCLKGEGLAQCTPQMLVDQGEVRVDIAFPRNSRRRIENALNDSPAFWRTHGPSVDAQGPRWGLGLVRPAKGDLQWKMIMIG